ncbi:MAG: biopolymer transporter ExbD [Gammaproteobacteria bacterium]|nr:biopolymer transporter ExbD [Gammaproteobacteria bacterium]
MARRHAEEEDAEINMTPLLDIVFIMLIFFIVTTSFVKEAGLEVNRPEARTAIEQTRANIMIAISHSGDIWMQKRLVELAQVRILIEQARAENPEGSVVIIADEDAPTGILVQIMDQARLAGVQDISVAAQEGSS